MSRDLGQSHRSRFSCTQLFRCFCFLFSFVSCYSTRTGMVALTHIKIWRHFYGRLSVPRRRRRKDNPKQEKIALKGLTPRVTDSNSSFKKRFLLCQAHSLTLVSLLQTLVRGRGARIGLGRSWQQGVYFRTLLHIKNSLQNCRAAILSLYRYWLVDLTRSCMRLYTQISRMGPHH